MPILLFSCESEFQRTGGVLTKLDEEFKGLYVATISNLDWPSRNNLSTIDQIKEIKKILDTAVELKINNIFLQVRPAGEVIYPSKYEPTSYFLTGKQGKTLDYDPLEKWISEAKLRNIKIHAWLNPYRIGVPEIRKYDKKSPIYRNFTLKLKKGFYWANPGHKETVNYILKIIKELIENYDIAGIHFDDYFYPYPELMKKGESFDDYLEYSTYLKKHKKKKLDINDWRRKNVNTLIKKTYKLVKSKNKNLVFGVAPFGIWKNNYPEGLIGSSSYDDFYADSLKWMQEGYLDYISPELYWPYNKDLGPYGGYFKKLLDWWNIMNIRDIPLYPAISLSSPYIKDDIFTDVKEQILYTKKVLGSKSGNIYFGSSRLINKVQNLEEKFKKFYLFEGLGIASEDNKIKVDFNTEIINNMLRVSLKNKNPNMKKAIVYAYKKNKGFVFKFINEGDDAVLFYNSDEITAVVVSAIDKNGREGKKNLKFL